MKHLLDQVNDFLDRYVLPWPVRFLTFRFVILVTIGLLVPLLVFADNTVLVLGINSYLNTMSVAVSSIVLLYATISEVRQKQIAEMQEKRAQEDHVHVTDMHQLVLETLKNQNEEIAELKRILSSLTGKPAQVVQVTPMPDLQTLHPRGQDRFDDDDVGRRWHNNLHHNSLVSTVREHLPAEKDKN